MRKRITISDIAHRANVSKMTVSRVLSGKGHVAPETAKRIKEIISEMGYQPNLIARSLSSKRSMIIGIIVPKTESIFMDEYIAQVLSGVMTIIKDNDYRIMLFPVDLDREQDSLYVDTTNSNMIDGLLLLKTKMNDPKLPTLLKSKLPFVLINHKKFGRDYNFIDTHNKQGAKIAVHYLYDRGYRKIAFVAGSMNETNGKDRLKGFQEAMAEVGLKYPEEYIVYGDFKKEKAYHEVGKLLTLKERPTAIFCSDDYMAIAAMQRIKEAGLEIPKDIAVIGFDNIELSRYVQPALTTIQQPLYELGVSAIKLLLNLITGKQKAPVHKFLNVKLIERQSC